MTRKIIQSIVALATALGLLVPQLATAQSDQNRLSLTVTPPLIQLSLAPGQTWSSSIKVVNSNPYSLPLYASVALLESGGDEGQSKFTPVLEEDTGNTLANWLKLGQTTMTLSQERSADFPFTITVPEDAPPGGHYAAILVGSQPPAGTEEGASISISSMVSSLLFLRVAGDVVEKGSIREFTSDQNFYSRPDAKFLLRFENQGNVHIQPQGEILITNMWGRQRGQIPINQNTRFGNVLPESVRKFEFQWKGEWNPLEFGRYKAQVALAYGSDAKETVVSTDYFWVIPIKETLAILIGFAIFVLAVLWMIRRYIRRSLARETERFGIKPTSGRGSRAGKSVAKGTAKSARMSVAAASRGKPKLFEPREPGFFARMSDRLRNAPILAIAIAVIVLGIIGMIFFFVQVLKSERDFEVEVVQPDNKNVILNNNRPVEQPANNNSNTNSGTDSTDQSAATVAVPVVVLNGTNVTGLAGKVAAELRSNDVTVSRTGNAPAQAITTITYHPDDKASAEKLNQLLGGKAELKTTTGAGAMTLTLGADYQ